MDKSCTLFDGKFLVKFIKSNTIKILVVGSAPETHCLPKELSGPTHIAFKYPEIHKYALEHQLYRSLMYDDIPYICVADLPYHLRKSLIPDKSSQFDFDKYRYNLICKVKTLYPNVDEIDYSFVTQQHSDPELVKTMDKVLQNDFDTQNKYGIKFTYNKFTRGRFQDYIKSGKIYSNIVKYDIVFFWNCGASECIIDAGQEYIDNFKSIMKPNGYIVNFGIPNALDDPVLCDFSEFHRFTTPLKEKQKVEQFVMELQKVSNGTYTWK
jgi:hypothetical protein